MKNAKNGKKDFAKKGGKKPSYSPVGKKKPTAKKNMPKSPRPVFAPDNGVDSENVVAGRNPVSELLRSGRTVDKLYVAHGEREGSIVKIIAEARDMGIPVVEADKYKLESIAGTSNHQGVVAFATDYDYCDIDDIFAYAEEKGEKPFIVVLDGVTDPRNLGAIIRTAECCGVHGIIIPKRGCCGLTTTVFKAAAGACEYMKIAKVTNIAETISALKARRLDVCGGRRRRLRPLFDRFNGFDGNCSRRRGQRHFPTRQTKMRRRYKHSDVRKYKLAERFRCGRGDDV